MEIKKEIHSEGPDHEKAQIRQRKKIERSRLTSEQCRICSRIICETIEKESWYQKTENLLLYVSVNNEVSLEWLMEKAWKDGKKVFLPRVHRTNMEFYQVNGKSELEMGSFHIMEPVKSCPAYKPVPEAVMVVPGVAFSIFGERIGYGKGYYDRYLNHYPGKIYLIGASYEMQLENDRWKSDRFDRKMDIVITEKRKVECNGESGRIV